MKAETVQTDMFHTFRFFPAEREVFRRKEDISTAGFAEKYRQVTMGAHTGPWRNDISPHLVEIMDTWDLPYVREVDVVKSPQTGGSQLIYNCEGCSVKQDPSTAMIVMPNQDTGRKVGEDRIIPMIRQTPPLARLMSDNPDDTAKQRIKFANGSLLYMAWANSTSALATFPMKRVYFDETDKYPPTVGKETDPISLGEKRVRTFRYTHKILKVSTPTREDGPIWKAFQGCEVQYRYFARCSDCGTEQPFVLDNLHYPLDRAPEDIRREHLAWYECESCHMHWNDYQRDAVVRAGRWKRTKGKDILRPRAVGFHMPSWISTDVSLSEIAAAWLVAKTDRVKLIDFYNDYLAEPFIEKLSDRKEDEILALRDDRPRGLVPRDIAILLCSIDTQQRGFYYEIRALGWGPSLPSWQVREGYVESFKGLEDILYNSEYKDIDGKDHVIQAAFIDSGGGTGTVPKHSRTAEVYDFCRRNPIVRPVKGRQTMTTMVNPSRIDFYPRTKKPIPGGLTLYHVNVTYFKDYLATKLAINPEDPGAWLLHSECPEEYARQMVSEHRDEKGRWQCPRGKPNHYWDIAVYFLAAAEILQVKFWKRPEEEAQEAPKKKPTQKPKRGRW